MDSKPINFSIYLFVVHFENIIQRFIQRCVCKYTNIMYDRYYKFKIELLIYLPNYFMFQVTYNVRNYQLVLLGFSGAVLKSPIK